MYQGDFEADTRGIVRVEIGQFGTTSNTHPGSADLLSRLAYQQKTSSGYYGMLYGVPLQKDLTGRILKVENSYFDFGGSSEIWKGRWASPRACQKTHEILAVKVLRLTTQDERQNYEEKKLKLLREAKLLFELAHPHIVSFYGVSFDFDRKNSPCLVYPFYKHGNIMSYILNIPRSERLKLICQVAAGLAYLHGRHRPVVHGDIKGINILIDDQGEACLTDFGLGRLEGIAGFTTKNVGGTCRWMAPELFCEAMHSKPTDMWGFGMTILEILTGKPPYSELSNERSIFPEIVRGRLPCQPPEIPEEMWALLLICWRQEPEERPSISVVAFYLNFLCKRGRAAKHCRQLLDQLVQLTSEHSQGSATAKYLDGGPVMYCNWPGCLDHFDTVGQCQDHEEGHWDVLPAESSK